jgi:hypothetical protein
MEKICQTGFMKKRIFWLKSWKKIFFGQFPNPWPLGCQGWVVIHQKVKKARITAP